MIAPKRISANARPLGYWLLQAFFVFSVPLMLIGQTICLFDYDLSVSMGMQESRDQVGLFGVQFNKAFGFGDTVLYVPLLIASSLGLRLRTRWALTVAGATLGISAYWSVTVAAALYLLPGTPGYTYSPGSEVIAFIALYAVVGVVGLGYVLFEGEALVSRSEHASSRGVRGSSSAEPVTVPVEGRSNGPGGTMVVRVFRARAHPGKTGAFREFFQSVALPLVRAQDGLIRAEIGWPVAPTEDEFLMVTVWRDLEALRSFAGEDWHEARLLPEERPLLMETVVHHYEAASL